MGATIQQIMDDALTIVGEVSGSGTQQYSEDRLFRDAIRSFNLLFKKYHWEQYRQWFRVELDETTGKITTNDLRNVRDFEDFTSVHLDGQQGKLPILPRSLNPYNMTGTRARYWTSLPATHDDFATKKLIFYPLTAEGFINIQARVYPVEHPALDFTPDSRFELDRDMLVYGTAFMTLANDDLNPSGATVAKEMMEMRFRDIMGGLASHPIAVAGQSGIPTEWTPA